MSLLRRYWGRLTVWPVLVGILVCLATLSGRSGTLAGVRKIDTRLIVDLVGAVARGDFGTDGQARLEAAVGRLRDTRISPHDAYLGVAIWRGDTQLTSNHSLLKDLHWTAVEAAAGRDRRFSIGLVPSTQDSKTWRVAFFRSELGHSLSKWNLMLPVTQVVDPYSIEVRPEVFVERGGPPALLAAGVVFALLLLLSWHTERQHRGLQHRLMSLKGERDDLLARKDEAEDHIRDLKDRHHELEMSLASADAGGKAELSMQLESVQREIDALNERIDEQGSELQEKDDRIEKLSGRKAKLEVDLQQSDDLGNRYAEDLDRALQRIDRERQRRRQAENKVEELLRQRELPPAAAPEQKREPRLEKSGHLRGHPEIERVARRLTEEVPYVCRCSSSYFNPDLPNSSYVRQGSNGIELVFSNGTWTVKFVVETTATTRQQVAAAVKDLNRWVRDYTQS